MQNNKRHPSATKTNICDLKDILFLCWGLIIDLRVKTLRQVCTRVKKRAVSLFNQFRFAAMLQDKFGNFVAGTTVPLIIQHEVNSFTHLRFLFL